MAVRSFASTIAANGSWTGAAVLLAIGAALLVAAALAESAHVLFGLADLTCSPCVDIRNAIDRIAEALGFAGAGAAGAGAAGSGGLGGGPTPPYSYPPSRPNGTDPADDVGDVTPRRPPERDRIREASERIQKWAEGWVGVEEKGTAPTAHLM